MTSVIPPGPMGGHIIRLVPPTPRSDVGRAIAWGLLTGGLVLAGIYFGSRRLRDFDAALVPYAGASVFSAFGLGYRYSMWLTQPADAPLLAARLAAVLRAVAACRGTSRASSRSSR